MQWDELQIKRSWEFHKSERLWPEYKRGGMKRMNNNNWLSTLKYHEKGYPSMHKYTMMWSVDWKKTLEDMLPAKKQKLLFGFWHTIDTKCQKKSFLSGKKFWNMVNFGFETRYQNFNPRMSLVTRCTSCFSEWVTKRSWCRRCYHQKKGNIRLRAARSEMLKSKGQVMIKWWACYLQVVGYWQWSDVKLPQTASDL